MCHSWQRGVWSRPLLIQTSQSPPLSHSSTQLQCSPSARLMVGIIDKVLSHCDYGLIVFGNLSCVSILRKLQDTLGLLQSHTRSDNNIIIMYAARCTTGEMFICHRKMPFTERSNCPLHIRALGCSRPRHRPSLQILALNCLCWTQWTGQSLES